MRNSGFLRFSSTLSRGHVVEQGFCESPESVAEIIESREAGGAATGELIVVEPHPPEVIIAVLRAIADAIEEGRPPSSVPAHPVATAH